MNAVRASLTTLSLLACTALSLSGCASDEPPTVLGPGVVTPGAPSTGAAPTSLPNESTAAAGPSDSGAPTGGAPAVPAPFRDDDADLDAASQTGNGRSVQVEEAHLSRVDGFVAAYSADGQQLLGSAAVKRSTDGRPVTITLDRPLAGTTQLLLELRADNGNGRFDPDLDPRVAGDLDDDELEVERLSYRVR